MKQIIPFHTFQEAIESFDNGGRFYNFLCHAKDGVVSPAELGKVAGVTHDPQAMILYLTMSISHLDSHARNELISHLDAALLSMFEKYCPVQASLEQVVKHGEAGTSTILVGTPKKISSTTDFGGSIMVPVIVDTVTSFAIVPIVTTYDVYELSSEDGGVVVTVAHQKDKSPLPERNLRIGGMLTALNHSEETDVPKEVFLEVQYFMEEN